MKDEEYVFHLTEKERKRNGYGAHNKKRQGGKNVRLPHEYLTRKEIEKLSGDCVSYNMNKPIGWRAFKKWPIDIQKEYIANLDKKYGPTAQMYADMLGTSKRNWENYRYKIKSKSGFKGFGYKADMGLWAEFLGAEIPTIQSAEADKTNEELGAAAGDAATSYTVKGDIAHAVQSIIELLHGTGARITIEVTL